MKGVPVQSANELFMNTDGTFKEFIPVDDASLDTYFESLDCADKSPEGPGQHKGARTAAKPKRRRQRSERQQLLNKYAQLRYRERKRQKQASLEDQVKDLGAKVGTLETLKKETDELEAQNEALEQQIRQREEAIATQKQAEAEASRAHSEGSSSLQQDPGAKKAELDDLVQRWLAAVEEIRRLYQLLEMDAQGSHGGGVLKHCSDFSTLTPSQQKIMANVIARVDALVETVIGLCVRVLRLDGLSVQAVMNASFERCSTLRGWNDEQKWLRAAKLLNFTPQQRSRILNARSEMLGKLQMIYTQRQRLNMEAVRQMMESSNGNTQQLLNVLGQIEENLREEQRAICEQEHTTFKILLTPLQSGLFVLASFPDHCDCLALLNAVHQLYGSP